MVRHEITWDDTVYMIYGIILYDNGIIYHREKFMVLCVCTVRYDMVYDITIYGEMCSALV